MFHPESLLHFYEQRTQMHWGIITSMLLQIILLCLKIIYHLLTCIKAKEPKA